MIELDQSTPWEPPERPRPRRPVQRLIATAAVLVVLLGLAAASRRPIGYGPAFTVDGTGLVNERSDGHMLFVLRQVNLNTSIIDAYRVSDGHPTWSRRIGRVNELVDVIRGRLVLSLPPPGTVDQEPRTIAALDVRDGHEVWRRSAAVPAYTDTGDAIGLLIVASSSRQVEALDVRTGATAWSHDTPDGAIRSYLEQPYRIAELEADGTLRILDAKTGRVTRTTHLTDLGEISPFAVVGDLMTMLRFGPVGPQQVQVFDLATGRQLWTQPLSTDSEPLLLCGPVMCRYDGTRTIVVDPRTGEELWRTAPTVHARLISGTHMITAGNSPPAAREFPTSGAVHDLRTGAVQHDLGKWRVVDVHTWPRLVVLGREGTDGATVGVLDVTTGHTTVFGRLNRRYSVPTCEVLADLFMCETGTHLSAFRIPG